FCLFSRCIETMPARRDALFSTMNHLTAARFILSGHLRDFGIVVIEYVVQQKGGALYGCETLKQYKECHRKGLCHFQRSSFRYDRFRQPWSNVAFALCTRRSKLIDAQPCNDRCEKGFRRAGFFIRCLISQKCFLNRILSIRPAAEHTISNRHQ